MRISVSLKHETCLFHLSSSEGTISGILSAPRFRSEEPNRFYDFLKVFWAPCGEILF